MKKILIVLIQIFCYTALVAQNDIYVNGYFRKNGTYIQPHYKTAPNRSMFDNFSTKGNINPYTGKSGWIEPYKKLYNQYTSQMPISFKGKYNLLFEYLNSRDSSNYFNLLNQLSYSYKNFFSALFIMNNNSIGEANKIFLNLTNNPNSDNFIRAESIYWLNVTDKYLHAEAEFIMMWDASSQYEQDKNYDKLIEKLNKTTNPLNLFHKYLIKFDAESKSHRYNNAINSLDSLMVYASEANLNEYLYDGYDALLENLRYKQNTLDTYSNSTYYYNLNSLIESFNYFKLHKSMPYYNLIKAKFNLEKIDLKSFDTSFRRTLADTTKHNTKGSKIDVLSFRLRAFNNDTLFYLSMQFIDDSTFSIYRNELSKFERTNSLEKSIISLLIKNNTKFIGKEYLINESLVIGLKEIFSQGELDEKSSKNYTVYIYSIVQNGFQKDLSYLFE